MTLWPEGVLLAICAFVASTIAAVTGTGGGIVLLPVLVSLMGPRDAIPTYTLAQFIGNLSRVWFNRREVQAKVVWWFSLGAVPLAILGGIFFTRMGDRTLVRLLGLFLIACAIWRRWRAEQPKGFPVRRFAAIGGIFAFVSATVGSAGPFLAPFFLAFGLVRGGYIGTEALGTAVMHVTKMVTYGAASAFSLHAVTIGALLGPLMIVGSYLGKRILDRLPERVFVAIVEIVMVVFGVLFLVRG